MKKNLFSLHKLDARKISKLISEPIVDVTITSPPYFNLKDYGFNKQIGFGQTYEDYLEDLKLVFKNIYECTKDTGTLWVIIDAYRKVGEVVPLPFDFSNKIKEVGWKLQEIIIWGKDRTVPWAHRGQMRNSFEYILVFSKSTNYKFYIDKIRDFQSLKKWWVKYPERYNPRGKTPEAIWNFDIPTQGSWGNGYIKHFCPLPEEMVAQIIKLTTKEGDVVLDPFSGSGTVLSKADNMKRKYIGTELNSEYIQMFQKYLECTGKDKRREYEAENKVLLKQNEFEKLILELRALKYIKVAFSRLAPNDKILINKIFVKISDRIPQKRNCLITVNYIILINDKNNNIKNSFDELCYKPPLSKFGIEPIFTFTSNLSTFISSLSNGPLFLYTNRITHKFRKIFRLEDINISSKSDIIISNIKIELNEKDFE
ncbi:MAG: site-specific DNA-methyltransferase [Candidatus Marinimicrobia bacterium]|nr:site-specific DNA-methyltransferase [Candidatus Neomarinimicrobiota bacterium]